MGAARSLTAHRIAPNARVTAVVECVDGRLATLLALVKSPTSEGVRAVCVCVKLRCVGVMCHY
jgi:hypothetical protein